MRVTKLEGPPYERIQCQLPSTELDPGSLGYKGYREKRASLKQHPHFKVNPNCCMRNALYMVDGQYLCTQHAGIKALEFLSNV